MPQECLDSKYKVEHIYSVWACWTFVNIICALCFIVNRHSFHNMHFLIVHAVWVILWPVSLKDSRSCRAIWLMGMCKTETVLLSLSSEINKVHLKLSEISSCNTVLLVTNLSLRQFIQIWLKYAFNCLKKKLSRHIMEYIVIWKKKSNQWFSYERLFKIKFFLRILWVWDCFWKTFRCSESCMPCYWSFIILLSEWSPVDLKSSTSQVQRSQKASDKLTIHRFYVIFLT